jgi:hypothetical protein
MAKKQAASPVIIPEPRGRKCRSARQTRAAGIVEPNDGAAVFAGALGRGDWAAKSIGFRASTVAQGL